MIELADVTKVYDKQAQQAALDTISLVVPAGQFVAIMGPSGSGKSTLLNLIAGLDRPTRGQVVVHGVALAGLHEGALARFRRRELGFVYQFFNLLNQLTVLDNIILPAQLAGTRTTIAQQHGKELLEQLGLRDKARAYPAALSGGQRQRVAIARALINHPAVLLADEPTGALDSRSGDQVMEVLADIHRQGQTVVLVTHDARLAAGSAERIITLRDGRIVDDALMHVSSQARPADLVRLHAEEV